MLDNTESAEIRTKLIGGFKPDAFHPEFTPCLDVAEVVVDEDRRLRIRAEPIKQYPEEIRKRLAGFFFFLNSDALEPLQEVVALFGDRKCLGGPVGEGQQLVFAAIAQLP